MATQAEVVQTLKDALALQIKTAAEIDAVQAGVNELHVKIEELEEQIRNTENASDELIAAADAVKAQAQLVDDKIPDLPPPPPPDPEG